MTIYQCSACNAIGSIRRSKSRAWELPLSLFGLLPFRCKACSKRFHRRWNIPPKTLAQIAIAPAAPRIGKTAVPVPAIDSYFSLKVDTPEKCPGCNAVDSLRRTKPLPWERPLRLFSLRPFRCKKCSKRFHSRWDISPQSLAQIANAPPAPRIRNTSVLTPAINSNLSLKVYTPEAGSESLDGHASNPSNEFSEAEKPSWPQRRTSFTIPYSFKSFGGLLLIHFIVGRTEFPTLGKAAMWVNLLSLVTLVGALLVFIDLYQTRRASSKAVGATVALVVQWASLFFATEFVYGFLLGPGVHGLRSDMALYREQSPWIWMTYAILPVSGTIGCSAYLFYRNRRQVRLLDS
jgi:hypothetical protein